MSTAIIKNPDEIYNKIYRIINQEGVNYFPGTRFIDLVREIDPSFPDYNSYMGERRSNEQSTTRKDFFREIFLSFTEKQKLDFTRRVIRETYPNNPESVGELNTMIGDPPIKAADDKVNSFFSSFFDSATHSEAAHPSDSSENEEPLKERIFIGHGHSHAWRDLKDFIKDRLNLDWDEFNRESAAGKATKERLEEMLESASFAFLVMTAEHEHEDSTLHARENVIHEIGLFQGRLGFRRAIVLLEEGCQEFSNITGVGQIRFPKGNIKAAFEDIRLVLEREEILSGNSSSRRQAVKKNEKIEEIISEFQQIKNKILMNSLEPVIREELKKLQEFFQKYPGLLQAENIKKFYFTFIKPKEIHLHFGAELRFTQSEFAEFRQQLFEIDLRSIIL